MKKSISIIGGGPAAMLCAAFLDEKKFDITIYERNQSLGRKFLVAGKGGFNLTHSEPIATFVQRYTPASFLEASLRAFTNTDLRDWLLNVGIPTFIGSSKRVYPEKGIKPIEVLQAIEQVLIQKGVKIKNKLTWKGWTDNNDLLFDNNQETPSDITIFALGGGSWKVTGSDGSWLDTFNKKGIYTLPFQASNCAYQIDWEANFIHKHEGSPFKNIAITCNGKTQKGEIVITQFGIEGNAIYALSPQVREDLNDKKTARLYLDLKPSLTKDQLLHKLTHSKSKKNSDSLKKDLKLSSSQVALLKTIVPKDDFIALPSLVTFIKSLPLDVVGISPLDEAISTTGGVSLQAVDTQFQLRDLKNNYCIGEMLDWDTPTGGYLLQACVSMGVQVAKHLNTKY